MVSVLGFTGLPVGGGRVAHMVVPYEGHSAWFRHCAARAYPNRLPRIGYLLALLILYVAMVTAPLAAILGKCFPRGFGIRR